MSALMLTASGLIFAQQQLSGEKPVELTDPMRLKLLEVQKEKLQKRIQKEDKLRDRCVPGVSPEAMEAANDRQDSICLALRSEMTDLTLEIEELQASQNSQSDLPDAIVDFLNGKKNSNEAENEAGGSVQKVNSSSEN